MNNKISNSIKYSLVYTTALVSIIALTSFKQGGILCNVKELKEKAKAFLDPYKYDSSENTRIMFKPKEQVKEVEVPLFFGEKYKIVFQMEGLPKPVEVRIYDRDKDSKKRKLLFSSKDANADKKTFSFEVSRSRHVFVDYVISAEETGTYSGCAVFVVGYKTIIFN